MKLENVMQAERASRAEEQKKREDAENKLREMELVRAGELQRIEAETTAKFAAVSFLDRRIALFMNTFIVTSEVEFMMLHYVPVQGSS